MRVTLIGFIIMCLATQAGAATMEDSTYVKDRVLAHTQVVPIQEHDQAFYLVMRKLFKWVQIGKTYGLSQADVDQIRAFELPEQIAADAVRTSREQIAALLSEEAPNPIEIGRLLNGAREAELRAKEAYYRTAFESLSVDGQAKLTSEYQRRLNRTKNYKRLDFAALAAEVPEYVIEVASGSGGDVIPARSQQVPPELYGKVFFDSK